MEVWASVRRRYLDLFSLLLVVTGLGVVAWRFIPSFRLSLLYLAGRSPVCPYELAVRAEAMIEQHRARTDEVAAKIRKVGDDDRGHSLFDSEHGRFWLPPGPPETLASLLVEQEHRIYGDGPYGVHEGDIVIDCGAHVGVFVREALSAGAEKVIAVEPSPSVLVALRRNLAEEIQEGRVLVVEKGVWNKEETVSFLVPEEDHAAGTVVEGAAAQDRVIKIPMTTVDGIVEELSLERVDFIKMDIEGSEQKALQGAQETLRRYRPRLGLASYHLPSDETEIPRLVIAASPSYQMKCGPCGEMDGRILPHTLQFK